MASSQDLMIFRGVSYVYVRLILHLQTDIADLESELDILDHNDMNDDDGIYRLQCWLADRIWCKEDEESTIRT